MIINHLEYNLFDVFVHEDTDGLVGVQQTLSNPSGADFQLVHLQTQFDTDANAADRTVYVDVLKGGHLLFIAASPVKQAANLTWHYHFILGINNYTPAVGDRVFCPLGDRLRLVAADVIRLNCVNLQVGDQFTNTRTVRNIWQTV